MEPLLATSAQAAGSSTWISACNSAPGWPNTRRSPFSTMLNWPWRNCPSKRSTARRSRPAPMPLPLREKVLLLRLGLFMDGFLAVWVGGALCTGRANNALGGTMAEQRRTVEQQAQGLPIDGQHGLAGHPWKLQQVAVQAGAAQGLTLQGEA